LGEVGGGKLLRDRGESGGIAELDIGKSAEKKD